MAKTGMDNDRWQRLESLFDAGVELDPADLAQFLDLECPDDPILRRQVESLILADHEGNSFIGGVIRGAASLVDTQLSSPIEDTVIGNYRLIRELGHGGMGTVYLAHRADDEYQKEVAIKVVKGGVVTADLLWRFRAERQILANLDHPYIARLLDGGTTEWRAPYVVMEYVKGEPIDRYCDHNKLTTEQRLALFRNVCSAVHYAHQNLVVHRDIKPANILVTAAGEPKLLDFGIAKLLKQKEERHARTETHAGVRLMTPEYASPEQIRGDSITTASDVYSLGVLLYELLTGYLPYEFKSRSPREIEQAICEQQPRRPSTAITRDEPGRASSGGPRATAASEASLLRSTTPARLTRLLRGDLDNIVLMAIRKEPERRYSSAEVLSEDIRRHLAGLPVVARGDSLGYRARKFIGRHTAGVSAAASIVLLIAALIGFYTWRLANERDRARVEAAKARQVSEFLTGLFQVSDPGEAKGRNITARELLDKGAAKIEKELAGEPAVQATMMTIIGRVYQSMGLYDDAAPLLEKALGIRRGLFGEENVEVARSMFDLGSLLQAKGANDRAEPLYMSALEIQRKLSGDKSTDLAETLNNLGEIFQYRGDLEKATEYYRQALALNRRLLGSEHREIATNLSNLATVMAAKGDLDSAISLNGEALGMRRRLLGDDHPDLAFSLNNQAVFLQQKGEYAKAEAFLRQSLSIRIKILGEDHPDVGKNLSNLGFLLIEKGDLTGAEPVLRRSLEILRKSLPPGHSDISRPLLGLGTLQLRMGEPVNAQPLLREAVEIRRKAMPVGHWRIAEAESTLGSCLVDLHEYAEAETLLIDSYHNLKSNRGKQNKTTIRTLNEIVKLYEEWGKTEKAIQYRAAL
jgi:serine/threonine protein kinase/tetratricopeptide (TPR) repeat protein